MKKFIYLGLLAFICTLTSKGQSESPILTKLYWDSISEGKWNIPVDGNRNQFFKLEDRVVFPVEENSGTTPTTVGGLQNLQPLAVFNTATGQFSNTNTNWTGDPVNPMYLHQPNSETFFIFDSVKVYKAEIKNDSVIYTIINNESGRNYYGYSEGKNKNYIFGYKYVLIFDKLGNFERELEMDFGSFSPGRYATISFTEYNSEIFIGLSHQGYGQGRLDLYTGKITINNDIPQHGGCRMAVIDDSLYMATNSNEGGSFNSVLYKMRNGEWEKVIFGGYLPEKHGSKWYIRIDNNGGTAKYANGVNLGLSFDGIYEFITSFDSVVARVKPYYLPIRDERQDTIDFWGNYYHNFQNRHGLGNVPIINYMFENTTGTVYGFGNNFVAKLTLHSASTGFSKKVTLPKVTIYPNPANEKITIAGLVKETPVNVINLTGKTVISVLYTGDVDISTITPGLYFVNVEGLSSTKLIIK